MSATDTPTLRQDRVRLVALLHAKEGLSFEAFDSYWTHEHAQVFASIDIVKRNLTKYEQVRILARSLQCSILT